LIAGFGAFYGDLRGVVPVDVPSAQQASWVAEHAWPLGACFLCVALGLGALTYAARALASGAGAGEETPAAKRTSAAISVAALAGAVSTALAGRDLSWSLSERPFGHERLIHLFVYNYGRPFPEYLDYRPALTGFAVAATLLIVLVAVARLRAAALVGLVATSFWFGAWSLDVYLMDLSPHWGQRELVKRYYDDRSGSEPIVAWQMNWKGENLYTGNRVAVFVQLDNKAITKWLDEHKGQRAYFLLEHSRVGSFRRMMGKRKLDELSTMRDNNKFILVRAEI
jgi:hypothetical protein